MDSEDSDGNIVTGSPSRESHRRKSDSVFKHLEDIGSRRNSLEKPDIIHLQNGVDSTEEKTNGIDSTDEKTTLIPQTLINLEDTFWYMKQRQWGRLYRASYGKPRAFTFTYLVFYCVAYGIYLGLQIGVYTRPSNYTLEYILMAIITGTVGCITPMFGWFLRLVLLETYAFLYTFFILNLYDNPSLYVPLGCVFVGVLLITSINFMFYPFVVRAVHVFSGKLSPKVEVDDFGVYGSNGPVTNRVARYQIETMSFLSPSYKCVFEGPLVDGQPDGFGTWVDTSFQGEYLQGYWHKGIPVGPFEAMENDTRNMLVNLQIVYGSNAGGKFFLQRTPLSYGVASIEACVSGHFFKGYPIVSFLSEPTPLKSQDDIKHIFEKKLYRHIDEDKITAHLSVSVDKRNRKLNIAGYHCKDRKASSVTINLSRFEEVPVEQSKLEKSPSQKPTNKQHQSKTIPPPQQQQEILLDQSNDHEQVDYSHEEQQRQEEEEKILKVQQKVFSNQLCLTLDPKWEKSRAREGILFLHGIFHTLEDACKRFGQFLALGHFPPYLKPFLFNWPSSTNPLFYFCASSVASDTDTHRDLKRFIKMLSKSGIETLHVMCHSMGSRFFLRSFAAIKDVFQRKSAAKNSSGSWTSFSGIKDSVTKSNQKKKGIVLQNLIFLNPDYEIDTFVNDYVELQVYTPHVTIYADSRDFAIYVAENVTGKKSLGLATLRGEASKGFFESVDVVDTVDLDRNMHSQFHGYFNINRVMVDDLYELIVTGKRAEERNSRLKRYKHVFRFTIVPSSVSVV